MTIQLRPATANDKLAVARIHVRAWQAGYRTLLPDSFLDALRPEDRVARYTFGEVALDRPHTLLACGRDAICGFVTTGPSPDADTSAAGHLLALYVDPDRWHHGIGRVLIAAARARLVELGYREAVLWILEGNVRAQRFYEADGWRADDTQRVERVWGAEVSELRYRRSL